MNLCDYYAKFNNKLKSNVLCTFVCANTLNKYYSIPFTEYQFKHIYILKLF